MSAFLPRPSLLRTCSAGAGALAVVLAAFACGDGAADGGAAGGRATASAAGYVGSAACSGCHADASAGWAESHHAHAMLPPEPEHMLGDFADRALEHRGAHARFFRDGERYLVNTEDADGVARDFEVLWAFGIEPLQQYLVAGEGGRMQVLPWCWDTRPAEEGGQRWYHLYPDEDVPPGDLLHWTGPLGEWNFMCADCHATALVRDYDVEEDRYHTRWEEAGVGCESCHGPGAEHVAWASGRGDGDALPEDPAAMGLRVALGDRDGGLWSWDPEARRPVRAPARADDRELQVCAPCHSRRTALTDGFAPDVAYLDQFRPEFLQPPLYRDDGAVLDEVYVWGSFVHSRMGHAGVSCTDCHDPHSGRRRLPGDALCTRCHSAEVYDRESHEGHPAGTAGSSCVDCHMNERTYMVVDARRDHAFRIPRPDLAAETGSPSACMDCHADRGEAWAAEAVSGWRGDRPAPPEPFGAAFHAARRGDPAAAAELDALVRDAEQPVMVRGSALLRLVDLGGARGVPAVSWAAEQEEGLLRLAAARAADRLPGEARMAVLPLLEDPLLAVRVEAARVLAPLFAGMNSASADRELEDQVFAEYREVLAVRAGRAQGLVEAALLDDHLGRTGEAEAALRRAYARDPNSVVAAANLADLLRRSGRDAEGLELLAAARAHHAQVNPAAGVPADLDEAYALALVRAGRAEDAYGVLRARAEAPDAPARAHYLWGVALLSAERGGDALAAFERGLEEHPWSLELLQGAADAAAASGLPEQAAGYRRRVEQVAAMLSR